MSMPVRDVLHQKGTPYEELDLANAKWSDDVLLDFMMAHPILINRPIVVTPIGTKLRTPLVGSKVAGRKSLSVKRNDTGVRWWNCFDDLTVIKFRTLTLDRARTNQSPSCGAQLIGRGRSMVAIKTLYTLPSANQNSMYIEPVRAKTFYTLI